MLIVSKFRDYYDTASAHGIDKECVFNREKKETELKTTTLPYTAEKYTKHFTIYMEPFVLGFCGKIYPGIKIKYSARYSTYPLTSPVPKDDVVYSYDEYVSKLKTWDVELGDTRRYIWSRDYIDDKRGAKDFFDQSYERYDDMFQKHHTPIFSIAKPGILVRENYFLTINPNLRDLQFMRVKDPHSTFQEIYQYMAGVLGNKEKEIVQISDKDMLKQKGFDQFSFKTMKGDKKPRAKNRGKNEQ